MAGKIAADAALMIADAALNGVFQGLSQALTPLIQKKLGQFLGVEKELKKLKRYLLGVQPLLKDAEIRQFTDESVRSWVADLMGLAYDAEDIVDEMNTQILRLQIEEKNRNDEEQVHNLFSSLNLDKFLFGVKDFSFKTQIASKINEVLERWEEIVEYGNALHLREDIGGRTLEGIKKRRETTSIPYENHVFGRDDDLKEISSLLKSDHESNGENVSVIAIVGIGGSGKTTLAKLAYNDLGVEFYPKAWVYVSHEFDCKNVTGSVIESLQNGRCDFSSLDQMQCCLRQLVERKKYLIVLDDVWTEDPNDWDCLMAPLRDGGKGSRIIVTTRSEKVSKSMGATMTYKLKGLSDNDCWAIVKKKAFGNNDDTNKSQMVEDTKMNAVSKCKGLPLVANVLGGFLRTFEIDNWGRLLKSELWDLPNTKDDLLPALILSYLSLSPHLKRCFIYCASFPKGYYHCKDQLVLQWMAQGFVKGNGSNELQDIGNDYFDDLVARHFLQQSARSLDDLVARRFLKQSAGSYVMHDLNHDLAQLVMGNISFTRIKEEIRQPTEDTRYMFLQCVDIDHKLLKQLFRANGVHSLSAHVCTTDVKLNDLIQNFERLRVLNFSSIRTEELPESVGNLKHLRFLSLVNIGIKSLPDSICSLYNLQTLKFVACKKLVELPKDIGNLINLCHLDLKLCSQFRMLPDSVCKLESLQVIKLQRCNLIEALPTDISSLKNLRHLDLSCTGIQRLPESIYRLFNLEFLNLEYCKDMLEIPKDIIFIANTKGPKFHHLVIGNEGGIGQLKTFKNLTKRLCIENLENVKSVEEAKIVYMKNKQQIVELVLKWKQVDPLNIRDKIFETDILEALEPAHANLKYLTINNCSGFKLPRWLGDPSFSNIVEIKLIACINCKLLAPLGQLCSLERLIVDGMHELKHVGREFFGIGAFPSLQKLVLENLSNLEGQFEVKEGDFSCLTELEVVNCPKLRELPIAPLSLEQLVVDGHRGTDEFQNMTALPFLPSLRVLKLVYCNEMILVNSLPYLTSIVTLSISDLPRVKLLPNGLLQHFIGLRELSFHNCYELLSLPEGLPDTLSKLKISNCPNLIFLPRCLPNTLSELIISHCPNLSRLPKGLPSMSSLQNLVVEDCLRLQISPEESTLLSCLPHVKLNLYLLV